MPDFTPSRLTIARMRRGLTKRDLAALVNVTPRVITAYESAEYAPANDTLVLIAQALGFHREFFFGPPVDVSIPDGASFRSLSTMTGAEKATVLAAAVI